MLCVGLYGIVQGSAVQYSAVQFSAVLCCAVQYSAILFTFARFGEYREHPDEGVEERPYELFARYNHGYMYPHQQA